MAQTGRYETVNTRSEHYYPRVEGSIPVQFLAEFILLEYNSGRTGRTIYLRKISNKLNKKVDTTAQRTGQRRCIEMLPNENKRKGYS